MIRIPVKLKKYTKLHRHKLKNFNLKQINSTNKSIRFISNKAGYLTLAQILFIKILLKKHKIFKKKFKINIPLNINYNFTAKSKNSRMGKGKGKPTQFWFAPVKYGTILFELLSLKKKFNIIALKYFIKIVCRNLPISIFIKYFNFN